MNEEGFIEGFCPELEDPLVKDYKLEPNVVKD